jgi:hypothetical protein
MPLYLIRTPCDEGSTPVLSAQILDAAGNPVGAGFIDALWLTLYDSHTLQVINNRLHINALTQPDMALDNQGEFFWVLSAADMAILDDARNLETHVVLLEAHWTAEGVPRVAYFSIGVPVRNLILEADLVPA